MSKPVQIEAMFAYAASEFGGVDVLVNNAGIQHVANVEDFPAERWDAIIAINLSSAFHTTRLALPGMKKRNWGRIINIASAHGLVASAQKSAYVAAKHGIVGFTKSVALETARTGVTVNAICPGWVLTPLVQKQVDARAERDKLSQEDAKQSLLGEKQPSMEFVTPEQLAGLAVFLCSPAADQIRGVAYNVDGGWYAQ
jgi:3-hydroxybutyrate dehydrogenase